MFLRWTSITLVTGLVWLGDLRTGPMSPALAAPMTAFETHRLPEVSVRTIEPEPIGGLLRTFSRAGATLTRSGERRHVPLEAIVRVSIERQGPEKLLPGPSEFTSQVRETTIALTNGDVLQGRIVESKPDQVALHCESVGRVELPIETLRRLYMPRAAEPGYRESLRWFEQEGARRGSVRNALTLSDRDSSGSQDASAWPSADDDALLLNNGDVLRGFILSIGPDGIIVESADQEIKVASRLLVAVRFAPPLPGGASALPASQEETPFVRAVFRDGTKMSFAALEVNNGQAEASYGTGPPLKFSSGALEQLEVIGGRWEWLSRIEPVSAQHTPMLGLDWHHQIDRNVLGEPLAVAGRQYDHGIGVHSRSVLVFELKGAYNEFVTHFGMDDSAGPLGNATAIILIDGQRRFERTRVRAGELLGPIRLPVTAANRLELIVDFGENGDIQDRFNWIEPALIR